MVLDREKVPLQESIEVAMRALIEKEASGGGSVKKADGEEEKALVIDTYALAAILKYQLQGLMLQLCGACVSVICARVSPKQKAKVVEMVSRCRVRVDESRRRPGRTSKRLTRSPQHQFQVKLADPTVQTLSIGDGANDVPMLQSAHIGVGVCGLEGQQAVNNSDYAVGQFRFLSNLLLEHGRFNYRRTSTVIKYIFYKNALLVLPQFFFGIFSAFSGQNYYNDVSLSCLFCLSVSLASFASLSLSVCLAWPPNHHPMLYCNRSTTNSTMSSTLRCRPSPSVSWTRTSHVQWRAPRPPCTATGSSTPT